MPKSPEPLLRKTFSAMMLTPGATPGAQEMIAVLLASDGETVIHPEPAQFYTVPLIGPRPETLNFTP